MSKYTTLKELTPMQKAKAKRITDWLVELKNQGVHPIVIDGGGGSGLQFVRCSMEDLANIGEDILNFEMGEEEALIYAPDKHQMYTIDYLVP